MTTRIIVTLAIPDDTFADRFAASQHAVSDAIAEHLTRMSEVEPDVWTVDVSSDIPGWSPSR